jgi:hypothetical protein
MKLLTMKLLALHLQSLDDPNPWIVEQQLFNILNDYLKPESTISTRVAAEKIDAQSPVKRATAAKETENTESFLLEI